MNKYKWIFLFVITILFVSCNDYYTSQPSVVVEDNNEYYVKYTVSTNYPYIFSNVVYADVNGTGSMRNYQTRNWSETIGPVKKGFRAFVRNENGTANDKIEVSKNGGPFALKAQGENSASYTIDF